MSAAASGLRSEGIYADFPSEVGTGSTALHMSRVVDVMDVLTKVSDVLADAFGQGYVSVLVLGLYALAKTVTGFKKTI